MRHSFCSHLLFLVLAVLTFGSCDREKQAAEATKVEKPEDNRFTPVALTDPGALDEPMMFQVDKNGHAYIIERKGALKKLDAGTKVVSAIAKLEVFTENEQGLIGLALHPDFEKNHWLFLQYAPLEERVFKLARYTLENDTLTDEKILLKIPVDREHTSHTGGGMAWDANGNLYLTVGNNTGNRLVAQTDERPGNEHLDDQRGASSTNDLRGKILRIHPEPDGTYSIPDGNLFPPGTLKTRPEIYTMGHRNVWRVSVDSKRGWIYWGEIGPDKDLDSESGPRGYDEQNQAKGPGFFGWPYFIADNQPIPKYDFVNDRVGEKLDPARPKNTSPNNTGLVDLPPAQPALIYYPYAASEKFPLVGSSSRCAIGGPIYHRDDFKGATTPYPAYYEGKWLMADYSRFWIMSVTLDDAGNYVAMERFAPHYHPVQPLDIKFAPDGNLYVLEYGSNTIRSSMESRLVRVEYNPGNRKPEVSAAADKAGGATPLRLRLNSSGTKDHDGDSLRYEWKLWEGDRLVLTRNESDPVITIDKPGVYRAALRADDGRGGTNEAAVAVVAGNEPPVVRLGYKGNKTFFFDNSTIAYSVHVEDREDGDLHKTIDPSSVAISIDYVSGGFEHAMLSVAHDDLDRFSRFAVARALIRSSDCRSCHTVDQKAVGPSFKQIAARYRSTAADLDTLAARIRRGSTGIWGTDNNMPAHPTISVNDARNIVNYILSLNERNIRPRLPMKGTHPVRIPKEDKGKGTLILRASYTDRGAGSVPSLTSDTVVMLRSPILDPVKADIVEGGALRDQLDEYVFLTAKSDSRIAYRNVDLTGVAAILFRANWHLYDIYAGGRVEV
ncbi:MAG TPA: PQQ-dependent sugar dehydrogenase, partial [Chryseosolibacter sp.]|nr:PQQ-dependent sugar dehydrogenase [Chryseosolibacter sp.]